MWYHILNYFFFFFHTVLMLFNTFGWAFSKTRKWNLVTLALTAGSWFVLGAWYGWGYCACTDWHWQVREQLGYHDQSPSYVHFLFLKLTGINFDPQLTDTITAIVFFISCIMSVWFNYRDRSKRKKVSL